MACLHNGSQTFVIVTVVPTTYLHFSMQYYASDATCGDTNGALTGTPVVVCDSGYRLKSNYAQISISGQDAPGAKSLCCNQVRTWLFGACSSMLTDADTSFH